MARRKLKICYVGHILACFVLLLDSTGIKDRHIKVSGVRVMLLFCVDEIIVVLGFFSFREKKATGQTWKEELAFRGRGSTAPVFLRSRVARSRAGQLDSGEGVLRRKLALGDP